MPLPEPYEYPSTLEGLQQTFYALDEMRAEVADKIAAMTVGEETPRNHELAAALSVGAAGVPEPEVQGVGHLLARYPTRAELESLLQYVAAQNRQVLSRMGESESKPGIWDLELTLSLTRNESAVARAIEIIDELDSSQTPE